MSREIKFRAWNKVEKRMIHKVVIYDSKVVNGYNPFASGVEHLTFDPPTTVIMQFTGLTDKNGLKEVYEGDIIDVEGNIKGNIYENNKESTDFIIQGFGTSSWEATNKQAMERGCKYSE